jgi:integrase/recombinase XerD
MSVKDPYLLLNKFLENEPVSDASKSVVNEYFLDIKLSNLKPKTVLSNVTIMMFILKTIKTDLDKLTEADSKIFQSALLDSKYAESTQKMYIIGFKRFLRWYAKNGHTKGKKKYLEICSNIQRKFHLKQVVLSDLLTADEVERMLAATHTNRNAAIIALLYDTGCRIGELVSVRMKDVVVVGEDWNITFPESKTKPRSVLLTLSIDPLSKYMDKHPNKNNPNGLLFVTAKKMNIGTKEKPINVYKSIDTDTIREILKVTAIKANVDKRVFPHIFRHTRSTEYSKTMNEAAMREIFGWVEGSTVPSHYIHLSAQDSHNAIKAHYGLQNVSVNNQGIQVGQCEYCNAINKTSRNICWQCKRPINKETKDAKDLVKNLLDNYFNENVEDRDKFMSHFFNDDDVKK